MGSNQENISDEQIFSLEKVKDVIFLEDEGFIDAAIHHIEFLKEIDTIIPLRDVKIIKNALYRYEKLWLPLISKHQDKYREYAPPIDVHWAWHAHLLAPVVYQQDCLRILNCEINHKLVSPAQRLEMRERAKPLWEEAYPDEPFDINLEDIKNIPDRDFTSDLVYDVPLATTRQKTFYYNVSLPHHRNRLFLKSGVLRYKKFLFLRKIKHGLFIVPYYDQDLMWHTHQLFPQNYIADTTRYLGNIFNHDDTDGGSRGPDDKLTLANKETKVVWREVFGESQDLAGTCYRGALRHHDLKPYDSIPLPEKSNMTEVTFRAPSLDVNTLDKLIDQSMTTQSSAEYQLTSDVLELTCKVEFNQRRNVTLAVMYEDQTVICGRNISNFEVPTAGQLTSDGDGSWLHMKTFNGDIAMVIIDYKGDWAISKINKRADLSYTGVMATWERDTTHWKHIGSSERRPRHVFDPNNKTLTVKYDELLIHHVCSAFVDLVLSLWPAATKNPPSGQKQHSSSNCVLL